LLLFDSIEDQRANRVKSWKLWGSIWGVEMREEEEMWGRRRIPRDGLSAQNVLQRRDRIDMLEDNGD